MREQFRLLSLSHRRGLGVEDGYPVRIGRIVHCSRDSSRSPRFKCIGETDVAEAAQRGLGRPDFPFQAVSDSAFVAISSTVVFYSVAEKWA